MGALIVALETAELLTALELAASQDDEQSALSTIEESLSLIVADAEEKAVIRGPVAYTEAVVFLREHVKPSQKHFKTFRDAMLRPLRAALDRQRDVLDAMIAPLNRAEATLKAGILEWEEREAARLDEERRQAAEAAEEAARAAREAEERALREAGMDDVADEVAALDIPIAPPVSVEPLRPRGVSIQTSYEPSVTDMRALCAAIAEGKVPANTVVPNMPILRDAARKQGTALHWPGVVVTERRGVRVRT